MTERILLFGVLHLFSETGTEGGYWAFMDNRFIKQNTTRFSCKICYIYWDKEADPKGPLKVSHAIPMDMVTEKDFRFPPECKEGKHQFEPVADRSWSYDGLKILQDGDYLQIFDKEDKSKTLWRGYIKLKRHDLFTQDAFGMWIHADQKGIERERWAKWFLGEHPALLIRKL